VDYRIKVFLLGTVCVYLVVEFVQKTSFKTVFFTFIGCRSEANREHLVRLEVLAESIYISETSVVTLVDQHDASLSGVLALQVCLEVHSVRILDTCSDKVFSKYLSAILIKFLETFVLENYIDVVLGLRQEKVRQLGGDDTFSLACRDYPHLRTDLFVVLVSESGSSQLEVVHIHIELLEHSHDSRSVLLN
jgi:hypothetical protein